MVSAGKIGGSVLLVIVSFLIVADLKHVREKRRGGRKRRPSRRAADLVRRRLGADLVRRRLGADDSPSAQPPSKEGCARKENRRRQGSRSSRRTEPGDVQAGRLGLVAEGHPGTISDRGVPAASRARKPAARVGRAAQQYLVESLHENAIRSAPQGVQARPDDLRFQGRQVGQPGDVQAAGAGLAAQRQPTHHRRPRRAPGRGPHAAPPRLPRRPAVPGATGKGARRRSDPAPATRLRDGADSPAEGVLGALKAADQLQVVIDASDDARCVHGPPSPYPRIGPFPNGPRTAPSMPWDAAGVNPSFCGPSSHTELGDEEFTA